MSCNKPVLMIDDPNTLKGVRFLKYNNDERSIYALMIRNPRDGVLELPCRKCAGCSQMRQLEWVTRFSLEYDGISGCYMFTFTFDNIEYLKRSNDWANDKSFQLFMKRLRRYWQYHYNIQTLKYIGARELGSKTKRVHYHAVIWGFNIPDLKREVGQYYSSKIISKLWPFGFISIIEADYGAVAYVLKYVVKFKQKNAIERGFYSQFIGKKWLIENKEIYAKNQLVSIKNKLVPWPKYFDRLVKNSDPKLAYRKKQIKLKAVSEFRAQAWEVDRFVEKENRELRLEKKK